MPSPFAPMPMSGPWIEREGQPRVFQATSLMYLGLVWVFVVGAVIMAAGHVSGRELVMTDRVERR